MFYQLKLVHTNTVECLDVSRSFMRIRPKLGESIYSVRINRYECVITAKKKNKKEKEMQCIHRKMKRTKVFVTPVTSIKRDKNELSVRSTNNRRCKRHTHTYKTTNHKISLTVWKGKIRRELRFVFFSQKARALFLSLYLFRGTNRIDSKNEKTTLLLNDEVELIWHVRKCVAHKDTHKCMHWNRHDRRFS